MQRNRLGAPYREPLQPLRVRPADTTGTKPYLAIQLSRSLICDRRSSKECIPYLLHQPRGPRQLRRLGASTGCTQPERALPEKKVHGRARESSTHSRRLPLHCEDETEHREKPGSFPPT